NSMKRPGLMPSIASRVLAVAVMLAGSTFGALAQTQDDINSFAEKNAQAAQSAKQMCQIIVQENGTMVQNVGSTKLSSSINAGLPGQAEVTTTNGSYYLSIDRPNGFVSTPAGGNTDVVFSPSFSGRGKTNFADTPGNVRVKMKNGVTQIEVNLEVSKLTGAFPAGYYQAEVTLRCE
ncbi:MAG: hypothetical protein ACRCU5_08165, partial [Rhizobiaceae bacterium]